MNERRVRVEHATDMDLARRLFREYQSFLNVDLCFQDFERELAELPGAYTRPAGDVLFGLVDDRLAGCVARRPLDDRACEMKRLFVREEARGSGLGRLLAQTCVDDARAAGFSLMRLDTLARLTEAVALYKSMGFKPCEPYYHNPLDGVSYWEKAL